MISRFVFVAINFIVAFAVSANAIKLESLLPKNLFTPKMLKNSMKPASKNLRTMEAVKGDTSPKMSFLYQYHNADCSGTTAIVSGNIFNTCLTNSEPDFYGNVHGTGIYSFNSNDVVTPGPYAETWYYEFASNDCSSPVGYGENAYYPEFCYYVAEAGLSIKTVFSNDTNIAHTLKGGVLFKYFDTNEHCKDTTYSASSYTWIQLNQCVPSGDDGKSGMKFVGCGNGKISLESYADNSCTTLAFKGDADMEVCDAYTTGPHSETYLNYYYASYLTHECT